MSAVVVLKLGSSVLPSEEALPDAVAAIYRHLRRGTRVIAVVSAVGRQTDALFAEALRFTPSPSPAALAGWLATGEARATALLGLALDRSGVPAVALDAATIGLRTAGDPLDADPVALDTAALRRALAAAPVVVIPGFVGRDADGRPTLLGRGGSDLTAVFVAERLGARCRLVKGAGALFTADPALAPDARRLRTVTWDDAARLGGVVQPKALACARARGFRFEVGPPDGPATEVGAEVTTFAAPEPPAGPLRVTLLGLGTVGGGVWRRLAAHPSRFAVVACAVRDRARHLAEGVPAALLHEDPRAALATPSDVVVEALGGLEPAASLVRAAIDAGRHVVTANKVVIALHGRALLDRAAARGVRLAFSACVGGSVPAVEAAQRLAGQVVAIEGVLNGTTNHVLDELAAGRTLPEAVARARALGLCEADPRADLDGIDACHKLAILARHAFGVELDPARVPTEGIGALGPDDLRRARASDRVIRLVARCRRAGDRVEAAVRPEALPLDHPLAGLRGEENGLLLHLPDGVERWTGRGAGRWPTAESVLADLEGLAGGAP